MLNNVRLKVEEESERLARKNELKAHGTLLMALPDKHQLKFNIHKDAKTLMEAIKKKFGENKETKKIAFVSSNNTDSTNEPISVATSDLIPQLNNNDLKQIDVNDLEEMDLKCYDWNFQAEKEPTNYALMAFTSTSSSSSDNELVLNMIGTTQEMGIMLFLHPTQEHLCHPNLTWFFIMIAFNVELIPTKPDKDLSPTHRPLAPIIEDWISDSEDDYEAEISQNAPSFIQLLNK
uniref:Uncharacterized protein n=1 Tax=Tanacetum cinerariifolium TaxID=118510 RepID=A0A6L2MWW8_TANCI|nr:hypothetical protein [Tanacetum cinerariifolium]